MDNLPRLSFYISGILIISTSFTLFSSELLRKLADPSWVGTAFLLGFGLVYMNIVFVISRRFMRRLEGKSSITYVLGTATGLAPIVWIFIFDAGLTTTMQIVFALTIGFACTLGAYFGHRAGLKAQVKFQRELYEYLKNTGQLPDELKRAHDNLNKN